MPKPNGKADIMPALTPLQAEIEAVFRKARGKEAKLGLLAAAMQCAGINKGIVDAVIYRARSVSGMSVPIRALSDHELKNTLRLKLSQAISYIDPVTLAQAGTKDLAITTGILTEKLQLLEGKPTEITRSDIRHMHELIPALVEEAARRGMIDLKKTIEGRVSEADYVEVDD